jgi:hypothetical protein
MKCRSLFAALRGTVFFRGIDFLSGAAALCAMDWPSSTGTMTGNFGLNDGGMPLLGAVFADEGAVGAADRGELLYLGRKGDSASRLPSPLGAWAAMDHGDGIISVYSRLDGEQLDTLPVQVDKNSPLGMPGVSGWAAKQGFYFFLFDRKERRWINPSMIITPFQDTRPPVIVQVRLRGEAGNEIDPAQTRTISQGRYVVSVAAFDTLTGPLETPLAPFRIVCSVNGREAGALGFETYSAREGALMVHRNGLVPVREVFAPTPGWEIGETPFTRGQATLEVIVQDIAGNSRNVVYRLQVE